MMERIRELILEGYTVTLSAEPFEDEHLYSVVVQKGEQVIMQELDVTLDNAIAGAWVYTPEVVSGNP